MDKQWVERERTSKMEQEQSPDAFKVPCHSKCTETCIVLIIPSNLLRHERV
jgi:hypothetical protein